MILQKPPNLEKLLARSDVWCASAAIGTRQGAIPTGFSGLDDALHYRGWPESGLVELLVATTGIGELGLLAPSLAHLSQQPGWLMLLAPPFIPYAPALQQLGINNDRLLIVQPGSSEKLLWATEQALQAGCCSAVLSWLNQTGIAHKNLRKLQLAARQSHSLKLLFRSPNCAAHNSPATLRIKITADREGLNLDILKQPGGWAGQQVKLAVNGTLAAKQSSVGDLPYHLNQGNLNKRDQTRLIYNTGVVSGTLQENQSSLPPLIPVP